MQVYAASWSNNMSNEVRTRVVYAVAMCHNFAGVTFCSCTDHYEAEFMAVCDINKETKQVVQDLNDAQVSCVCVFEFNLLPHLKQILTCRCTDISSPDI